MMKKSIWMFVVSAVVLACVIALSVFAFVQNQIALGVLGLIGAVIVAWVSAGFFRAARLVKAFDEAVVARDYQKADAIASDSRKKAAFLLVPRYTSLSMQLKSAMICDRLEEAERVIAVMRHDAGLGWYYRTAYCHILILLDREENEAARREYEEFRVYNENVELYREQLEVLDALFARLFTHKDERLPESVGEACYPVVQRILGKHFERKAAESFTEWD